MKKKVSTDKDPAPMDFSPFDPLTNLEAVAEVIRTIRHISWSYAGDIARVVFKIGKTFYAGRCVVCVCGDEGRIEVFEYTDGSVESLQVYLESTEGQNFLSRCLELAPECVAVTSLVDSSETTEVEPRTGAESGTTSGMAGETDLITFTKKDFPEKLLTPASYVFPLRHQYGKRHVVKPGLLLMQEPTGLTRWNKRFLDSVIVVAEYLAMIIECERLYSIVQNTRPQKPDSEPPDLQKD